MSQKTTSPLTGDIFGGLASMLVAFPSAVAFGLIVFAPLGPSFSAQGALAGMLGALALGLVSPALGGAPRLITAPCAPAAAVLAAFVATHSKLPPESILILTSLVTLFAGFLQFGFGMLGGGRLIKYIPYPVVAGYLSGVGVLIILSQLPKLLGLPKEVSLLNGVFHPSAWDPMVLVIGLITILAMVLALRLARAVPAPIIALVAGVAGYWGLSLLHPELQILADNKRVIGRIEGAGIGGFLDFMGLRLSAVSGIGLAQIFETLASAFTLAILLSVDTLKTCVVLDALTQGRHDSNRELRAQGAGNTITALMGGLAGAGTMGATLVNLSSGGKTSRSGVLEGVFSLLTFLFIGSLIAWIPVGALAGILIIVGVRMIDRKSLHLLKQRSTWMDFAVIAAVIVTAVALNLIAAAGVGLAMAILLFIRDQTRSSVVRRLTFGHQVRSKRRRLPRELEILQKQGSAVVIFELQGALFFGTTDQLFTMIEPHLIKTRYLILDMHRVQAVDFTAAHMLELLDARLTERGGSLLFSSIPRNLPTGKDLKLYFDQVGLVHPKTSLNVFPTKDDALEWVENQIILAHHGKSDLDPDPLEISEIEVFSSLSLEIITQLKNAVEEKDLKAGEMVFKQGDPGDDLNFIRKGIIRIELPIQGHDAHHLATFGSGDCFGDMSFLDQEKRSANAVAQTDAKIFRLSRKNFDQIVKHSPKLGEMVFEGLARTLAIRLRHTDAELRAIEEA